jgi:hypothetical protein
MFERKANKYRSAGECNVRILSKNTHHYEAKINYSAALRNLTSFTIDNGKLVMDSNP